MTVSGSGNVAINAINYATSLGATVPTASDSQAVVDEQGIDIELLRQIKITERPGFEQPNAVNGHFVSDGSIWEVPVDVAIPCDPNELSGDMPQPW